MNERKNLEDQSPEQLERDIDRTRSSLGRTVDQLESRLSPGQMLDQFLGTAREHGGEFAANLGRSVRDNPMPMVLTSVGLAWMIASSNGSHGTSRTYSGMSDKAGEAKSKLQSGARSAKSAASAVGDRAAHAREALGESASHVSERMRTERERLGHGFSYMMEEQPLLVGALGIAFGAALGAALPRTEQESRLMGEASERAARTAKEKARDTFDEARDSAADAVASREEGHRGRQEGEAGDTAWQDSSRPRI